MTTPHTGNSSKLSWIIAGLLLAAVIGILDVLTGPNLSFEIFYLIPIAMTLWFAGKWPGIFIAVVSAAIWVGDDLLHHAPQKDPFTYYWNLSIKFTLFAIISIILPLFKNEWDREKELARTDYLTGLANKRCFYDLAEMEVRRDNRYNHPFTFAYLDIDNFKYVNDRMGHNAGDTLLQMVGQTLKKKLRAIDLVARLGGDEFVILLPETQSHAARIVIQRIHKELRDIAEKNEWPVTFSIGVATFVRPPESVPEMIKKADALMYAAKNSGKNVVKYESFGGTSTTPSDFPKPQQDNP